MRMMRRRRKKVATTKGHELAHGQQGLPVCPELRATTHPVVVTKRKRRMLKKLGPSSTASSSALLLLCFRLLSARVWSLGLSQLEETAWPPALPL